MAKKTTSPKGGKRGCLGKDGKYSPENCTGELHAQGIGSLNENNISVYISTNEQRVTITER